MEWRNTTTKLLGKMNKEGRLSPKQSELFLLKNKSTLGRMNQGLICSYQWDAVPTGPEPWFDTLLSSHPAPLKEGCGAQDRFSETVALESSGVSVSSAYRNSHP